MQCCPLWSMPHQIPSVAAGEDGTAVREPLVSPEAEDLLKHATELDYMTHLVFRMFENKR